jgi:hypothetical protein
MSSMMNPPLIQKPLSTLTGCKPWKRNTVLFSVTALSHVFATLRKNQQL